MFLQKNNRSVYMLIYARNNLVQLCRQLLDHVLVVIGSNYYNSSTIFKLPEDVNGKYPFYFINLFINYNHAHGPAITDQSARLPLLPTNPASLSRSLFPLSLSLFKPLLSTSLSSSLPFLRAAALLHFSKFTTGKKTKGERKGSSPPSLFSTIPILHNEEAWLAAPLPPFTGQPLSLSPVSIKFLHQFL